MLTRVGPQSSSSSSIISPLPIREVNLVSSDIRDVLSNQFLLSGSSQTYYLNNETRVLITVRSLQNFTLVKTWELFKRKNIYTSSPLSLRSTHQTAILFGVISSFP